VSDELPPPPPPEVQPNAPEGWPTCMAWPPPRELIELAKRERMRGHHQIHFGGRPLFLVDGIALDLMVLVTGHRIPDGVDLTKLAEEAAVR